jgi:hypothetical protein
MAHRLSNGIRNVEHPSAATYICRHTSVDTHLCRHTSVDTHLCWHTPLLVVTSAGGHPCQLDPHRAWLHLHSNPAPDYRLIADTRAHRHDSCQYGHCYWVLAETQGLAPPVCCHIGSRNHGEDGVNSATRHGLAPLLKRAPPL